MTDIHIDDFYRDTAKTLVTLYNTFPRHIMLFVEDICGPDAPDDFGLHSKRHDACLSALMWLGTSDYIQYKALIKREAIEEATLTHRAFILLNSAPTPQGINAAEPHGSADLLINQLREQLQSGTSSTLALFVKSLMANSRQLPASVF
jgi:hypothetical protein